MGGEISNRHPGNFHSLLERNEHEIIVGLTHRHRDREANIIRFEALSSDKFTLKAGEIRFSATCYFSQNKGENQERTH
jgi:hypothetical protein